MATKEQKPQLTPEEKLEIRKEKWRIYMRGYRKRNAAVINARNKPHQLAYQKRYYQRKKQEALLQKQLNEKPNEHTGKETDN